MGLMSSKTINVFRAISILYQAHYPVRYTLTSQHAKQLMSTARHYLHDHAWSTRCTALLDCDCSLQSERQDFSPHCLRSMCPAHDDMKPPMQWNMKAWRSGCRLH